MSHSALNTQLVESVASTNFLNISSSPASAQAMLDAVMSETLGMAMHNAVMRQQANSMVSSAATTAACARMLQVSGGTSATSQSLPPATKPVIPPLDGDSDPAGAAVIAQATAKASNAINALARQAARDEPAQARSALASLANSISRMVNRSAPPSAPGA